MSILDRIGLGLIQKNPEAIEKNVDRSLGILVQAMTFIIRREVRRTGPENVPRPEINEHYRDPLEIVQSTIETFQNETGEKVTWERNSGYFGLKELQQILSKPLEAKHFHAIRMSLFGKISDEEFLKQYGNESSVSHMSLGDAIQKVLAGGGSRYHIFSLIYSEMGESYSGLSDAEDYATTTTLDKINSRREKRGQSEITLDEFYKEVKDLIHFVEAKRETVGQPISIAEILGEILKRYAGNMNDALSVFNSFLKYVTRNQDPRSEVWDDDELEVFRANWVRKHILDEFSPMQSYNELPEATTSLDKVVGRPELYAKILKTFTGDSQPTDFDPRFNLLNRVGSPYHVVNLIELLQDYSPDMIMAATAQEYLQNGQHHGSIKALADVMLLHNLRKIDKYLNTFSSSSS